MSDNKDSNGQEYKGLSKTSSAVGQGFVDGAKGLVVGGAIGAVVGAVAHNKEAQKEAINNVMDSSDIINQLGELNNKKAAKELFRDVKLTGILKTGWNAIGRGGKALVGAAIVGIAVASVTQIVGYFRGAKKANAARQQFDEITAENRELKGKLSVIEAVTAQAKPEKSFVVDLENKRSQQASQAPAI